MDDKVLPAIVVIVCVAILTAIAAWLISNYRQRTLVREAREWPTAEATVQSGSLERTRDSGRGSLPTFEFSYEVGDDRYSGRFVLLRNVLLPDPKSAQAVIDQVVGRKLLVHFDPSRPEVWFLSDETVDGWKVQQKIGSHIVRDLSPRD